MSQGKVEHNILHYCFYCLIIALYLASKRYSRWIIKHGQPSCGKRCKEKLHFRREKAGSWLPPTSCFYPSRFMSRAVNTQLFQTASPGSLADLRGVDFIQIWKWPGEQVWFRCSERERKGFGGGNLREHKMFVSQ